VRRRFDSTFKTKVALAAVGGDNALSELASEPKIHANLISQWKQRLLANVTRVFDDEPDNSTQQDQQAVVEELHRQVGKLHVEFDWLKKSCPARPLSFACGSSHNTPS
jgi:transposase